MTLKKQKLLRKTLFLILVSFCMTLQSFAQSHLADEGKTFFVAFGKNDTIRYDKNVELALRITATAAAKVKFSFTANPSLNDSIMVSAGEIRDYVLSPARTNACYSINTSNIGIIQSIDPSSKKKSICVTATEPITLIAVTTADKSVEAALVFPVENLGTEYIHVGMDRYNTPADTQNSGFIVVATEDNTTVDLFPDVPSIPKNLDKGEMIYYGYPDATNWNAMGMSIKANKPVAYFQCGSKSMIPGHVHHNPTFEQIPSVDQWGQSFILPTTVRNTNLSRPTDLSDNGGAFARIYPKETPTNVTVKYTNGDTETITIDDHLDNHLKYKDIKINSSHHEDASACYISSDKPVAVCTYHYSRDADEVGATDVSQPGVAWLPPLEQKAYRVEVSPLDLDGKYVQLEVYHYLLIITPTANKNRVTLSSDGGQPQYLNHLPESTFVWVADNVGGSGYSFGRYCFGSSDPHRPSDKFLHTTALIESPDGMIVLSYGQGSYTNYFYPVGFSYNNMETGFYLNGEHYIHAYGRAYCDIYSFVLEAFPKTPAPITWKLNGTEIPDSENEPTVTINNLPSGHYAIEMIAANKTYQTHFWVGGGAAIWTPEANPSNIEEQKMDWNVADNWTPSVVPQSCYNVYIPGNSKYYPQLEEETNAVCRNIYFMQGGELGRPDLLTYRKAYVQYNFGLSESPQEIDNDDMDLLLHSTSTIDRMLYSAAISANVLERERWYLLSSPLRKVVTGDLGFGGFPLTFLRKFGPIEKEGINYETGNWTSPYNSMAELVTTDAAGEYIPTGGFAFFMYGMINESNDESGCHESGDFDENDLIYLPDLRDGENYGIKKTNGILELPFFADSIKLYAHRTQVYDPSSNKSTFYFINDDNFNTILEDSESVERESDIGNYRFAPEYYENGHWIFEPVLYHPGEGLSESDEFLVGNPYMSSIDMLAFLNDNSNTVLPQFRTWNGEEFISYSIRDNEIISPVNEDVNPGYVAPLQSFLLKTANNYNANVPAAKFDVELISKVRPVNTPSNLRMTGKIEEANLLRIKAENNYAASHAVIGYKKGASNAYVPGEDVQKLFSPLHYVPEVYSLAGDMPADINFISDAGEIMIPLGVKTGRKGEIRLTFTGMDNYSKASFIKLFDAFENRTIDLSGLSSYTYTFNHSGAGIQNGRFYLRIASSMSDLSNVHTEHLKVYSDANGIYVLSSSSDPVRKLEVYDLQGRKVYESNANAGYYALPGNYSQTPLIVKVMTNNESKTVKINMKL